MYLFLDPRSQDEIKVGILGTGKPDFFVYRRDDKVSLLEFITKKLPVTRYPLLVTDGIVVIPGPGGFSNVREAITLANTLGFALKIPVTAIKPKKNESPEQMFKRGVLLIGRTKPGKIIHPIYDKEPNITLPRKCGRIA